MHIAICDDNIAGRKQTERLMEREADKWIAQGNPLYIFTFGSVGSLLASAIEYDAIFLDIKEAENDDNSSVISKLREKGNNSPIVLTIKKDEWESVEYPEDILFLEKEIKVSELHDMMEKIDSFKDNKVAKIELRGEEETLYVSDEEIHHAEQEGAATLVYFSDGRIFRVHGNAYNLYQNIANKHETFVMPNGNTIINIRYVESVSGIGAVKMTDGKKYLVAGNIKKYIKQTMEKIKKE